MSDAEVELSRQVFYALTLLTDGRALEQCQACGSGEGFEAWRQLHSEHKPAVPAAKTGDMQDLLAFTFEGDLVARIALFDCKVRECQEVRRRTVDLDVVMGIVSRNLQDKRLRRYLIEHIEKYHAWEEMKADLRNYQRIENLIEERSTPQPAAGEPGLAKQTTPENGAMEVDSMAAIGRGRASSKERREAARAVEQPGQRHRFSHDISDATGWDTVWLSALVTATGWTKEEDSADCTCGAQCWRCGGWGHRERYCGNRRDHGFHLEQHSDVPPGLPSHGRSLFGS
ncbi:unnamed protein product [Polarella glacialis]|uniref:CCHC-type domain-containing protein n=1 Tax=Polarella glacialis TaxID=89957 RepID=A0A813GTB3_POLGL|nr:unnamed protein product [Polarella glacialis]